MLETGAVVVAWTDDELLRLEAVLDRARSNGIAGVRRIGAGELQARVPGLSRDAKGAVLVPGEHVIDPWSAPLAYLTQAVANGAAVLRSAPMVEFFKGQGAQVAATPPEDFGRMIREDIVKWKKVMDAAGVKPQ